MTEDSADTTFDPLPAAGKGSDGFDEPALFYLTHQKAIDEWYALRKAASGTIDDWLRSVVLESMGTLVDEGYALTSVYGPSSCEHLLLHHDQVPIVDGEPTIGLGIGWKPGVVNPASADPPFVCVRRSETDAGQEAASRLLDLGGRTFRESNGHEGKDGWVWPIWWYVPGQHGWWTDLDAYCEVLVDEARGAFEVLRTGLR